MTDSPLSIALSYAGAGLPVFPCREKDEETDEIDDDGVFIVKKAKTPRLGDGFKGATKNLPLIERMWKRDPGSMIGLPTGEQLGAWVLDVDVHKDDDGNVINGFETLAVLEDQNEPLPRTAVARTAGGGEHHYFAYVPGVRNRGRLGAGLDIRGSGGYVVAPGSRLADGREYLWVDHDGDGLPPLPDAPQWLLDLVLPASPSYSSDYTYTSGENTAYIERAVEAELRELATAPQGGRGEAVNRSAYNLGTLVGAGALSRQEAEVGLFDAAYANGVVSKDGEKEIRAKIKRGLDAGIKKPRAIPEPTAKDDTPIVSMGVLTQPRIAEPVPTQHLEPTDEQDDDIPEYKLQAVGDLEALTYPGGLVQDLVDWIVSSAEQPCRALALAAVLPFVAALCGPRYSTSNRDTRPNIYTVALAESGFGKEHARSQIKRILMSDHGVFSDYSGPARIMSASALREVLESHQSVNCQIDEFGGFIRNITDRKAGSHQQAISADLRDYYSASSTFFEGAAYRGTPAKKIFNPNLCIHGTSTPEQFWTALSSASAEDGLLPRLILFHVTGNKPAIVKPVNDVRDPPYLLMTRMAEVAGINVVEQRTSGKKFPAAKGPAWQENKPKIVPWTEDALETFKSVKSTIDANEAATAPEARPFMRRIVENAIKLALIVAVGRNPAEPIITEEKFEWAAAVSWTCAASMVAEVTERLADNQREANYKRIEALVRKAGGKGLTEGRLVDRCKAIDARQREEIVKDLVMSGRVIYASNDNVKKGPKTRKLKWVG